MINVNFKSEPKNPFQTPNSGRATLILIPWLASVYLNQDSLSIAFPTYISLSKMRSCEAVSLHFFSVSVNE